MRVAIGMFLSLALFEAYHCMSLRLLSPRDSILTVLGMKGSWWYLSSSYWSLDEGPCEGTSMGVKKLDMKISNKLYYGEGGNEAVNFRAGLQGPNQAGYLIRGRGYGEL